MGASPTHNLYKQLVNSAMRLHTNKHSASKNCPVVVGHGGEIEVLSAAENKRLTEVGPETPMGDMMRRYWLPICLSEELPAGSRRPIRVRLLGESLVAFRDQHDQVGLLSEFCPHRTASLYLGRNEEDGLRCLYHGWKFDVHGRCLDMPTEPPESRFKERLRIPAYPTREGGGLIWAYLGPSEKIPSFPNFSWMTTTPQHRAVLKWRVETNYLQAVEGSIDTVHSYILHTGGYVGDRPSDQPYARLECEDTEYGFRYAAIRAPKRNPDTTQYVRTTLFVMPFYCVVPPRSDGTRLVNMFVPLDDTHTFFYWVYYHPEKPQDAAKAAQELAVVPGRDLLADYSKTRSLANDFGQDRNAMEQGLNYTGIDGVPNQDMAMQESMGAIADRTQEHLGVSDLAIIRLRRRLLQSLQMMEETGDPLGMQPAPDPGALNAAAAILPINAPWQTL